MHRKTREFPTGQIVALAILVALAIALAVGISALGSPAAAASTTGGTGNAWQTASAANLAKAASNARPWWDGRHPKTWTGQHPMCEARYHGRHGWVRPGNDGPRFRVVCEPIGDGWYAWDAVKH
jgi:hypothetical protein